MQPAYPLFHPYGFSINYYKEKKEIQPYITSFQYVMRLLEKEPRKRPHDALEVSRDLSRLEREVLDVETGSFPVISGGSHVRRISSTPHRMKYHVHSQASEEYDLSSYDDLLIDHSDFREE